MAVIKLIKDNFGPGDKLLSTSVNLICQAFNTAKGQKILLTNPLNKEVKIILPEEAQGATVSYVDKSTGENSVGQSQLTNNSITPNPFAMAVAQLK